MNTDWQEFNSVCGFKAHWRREAATLHLKYPSKPLDAYNVAAKDAEAMFGLKNSYSWISMERGFEFTTSIRVPQWEKEIFDPLSQNAPAFQPYYLAGDTGGSAGGTTVALPADDSRHIRVTIPGMEPTKEGYCMVSVQVGDKTESLVVKESELSKVRISLVPKIVII